MEIEINGLKYRQVEQNSKQSSNGGRMATMLMGLAMMYMPQGNVGSSKRSTETPRVNIIEEYKLIQEKKSKLSRKDRDWVVRQFHRNFQLITI